MAKKEFDKETNQQLGRAAAIEAMLDSSGWAFAEQDLQDYIGKLKDITTIDMENKDVVQQLRDQINTAAVLEAWLEELKSQVNNAIILTTEETGSKTVERR